MSYPTFSFGAYAVPNFKTYAYEVTDSLQIGTHLNIQLLSTRNARVFQTFHSELSIV